jgi:hypothetical protein
LFTMKILNQMTMLLLEPFFIVAASVVLIRFELESIRPDR